MCHNSSVQNAQIKRCVDNGMPEKIIKSVKYTIKKRVAEFEKERLDAARMDAKDLSPMNEDLAATEVEMFKQSERSAVDAEQTTENVAQAMPALKIPKLCGRFRQLQANNNNNNNNNSTEDKMQSKKPNEVYVDALAIGTQLTRQFFQHLNRALRKLQNTKIYVMLTTTTQPAHIIAICILSFVLLTVWPELFDSTNTNGTIATDVGDDIDAAAAAKVNMRSRKGKNTLATIAYLGAFATHFGAQIWMTFVSGLSLYFSLPRHTFGQCQQILFPRYFVLNALLSISMLILYVKYFLSAWNIAACLQLMALALTASIEVSVRLYLAPPLLRLMHEKYKIEFAIGSGKEVGNIVQGDLINCPHYQRIHKRFRRIHMTVAMGNMTVLTATCLHLYLLASKLQLS